MIEMLDGTRETVDYRGNAGVRLYINEQTENYPLHWHAAVEIIMPLENHYTAEIDKVKYVLNPFDLIIIPSGELHRLYAPSMGKRMILLFDFSMINNINGIDSAFHMMHPCTLVTPASAPDVHEQLKTIMLQAKEEYSSQAALHEAAVFSLMLQFFIVLGRNCMKSEDIFSNIRSQKQNEYIDKFIHVCNYMNEHCTEQINVDDLADLAGFSKFHFIRLFKQFTSMTYYDYLNKRRIMHAECLLTDPSVSITEVAMRSGFNSLATFNRIFKALKNCTPTEYKRLHGSHGSANII